MNNTNETNITEDLASKKITVTRDFNAPLETVWRYWTESALLDQWWAPKPWKAETKTMDFKAGGEWFYAMVSPEGDKHWNKIDFNTVDPQKQFTTDSGFCDEQGNFNPAMPLMHWRVTFASSGDTTTVISEISFESEEDMKRIVEMGFKGGFSMGLANLDELLAKR